MFPKAETNPKELLENKRHLPDLKKAAHILSSFMSSYKNCDPL
jgi:hypothetical protein